MGTLMLAFWLCSLIGTIGYASTRKKGLGTLALVGFAGFVPIGLIGALSLQKQMRDDGVLVSKQAEGKDQA